MTITIRPAANPAHEINLTHALIAAVAHQIHLSCGGNDVLNWLEAENFIARLAAPSPHTTPRPAAAPQTPTHTPGRDRLRRRQPRLYIPSPDRYTGPIPILGLPVTPGAHPGRE